MSQPIALAPPLLRPVPCAGPWPSIAARPAQNGQASRVEGARAWTSALSLGRYLAGTVGLSTLVIAPLVVVASCLTAAVLVGGLDDILHAMTAPTADGATPGYVYPLYGLGIVWLLASACAIGGLLMGDPWTPADRSTETGIEDDQDVRVEYRDHGPVEWAPGAHVSLALPECPVDDATTPNTGVLMPATATPDMDLANGMAAEWASYQSRHGEMSLATWFIRLDEGRSFPAMIRSHDADTVQLMVLQTRDPFVMSMAEFEARKGAPFLLDQTLRHSAPETYAKHSDWLRSAFLSLDLSVGIAAD